MPDHSMSMVSLAVAIAIAIAVVIMPSVAHAGIGHMFCGLAGAFGRSQPMKAFATGLIIIISVRAIMGRMTWDTAFLICLPIIILAGGTALLNALSGENCQ